jgi:putative transposase
LRAERPNHVWSYDFVEDRTHEGRKYRMLNIIDESVDVIDVLSDLFILRGVPERLRSNNGPAFVAKAVQDWIAAAGAKAVYIAGQPPGERLHRELQRSAPGRAAGWGDFLFARGGQNRGRKLAAPLQRQTPACVTGLQPAPEVFIPTFAAPAAAQSRPAAPPR